MLLVESSNVNCQAAQLLLGRLGYECDIARNGREALETLAEKQHPLVLMDYKMPVMDGLEATRRIRQLGKDVRQPVIVAMAAADDGAACQAAGMDDILAKPIRQAQLKAVLEKYAPVVATEPAPGPPARDDRAPSPGSTMRREDFRVLVVDDQEENRKVLCCYLFMEDYSVTQVTSGADALDLIARQPFDLVILDIMMPQMSGYEVCRKIREHHPPHKLPVIMSTACDQVEDLLKAFEVGANDYLIKPIRKQHFLRRVETQLQFAINRRLEAQNRGLQDALKRRLTELEKANTELVETRDQMIIQAKLASLGTLASGIAHELRNPLNFIINFSELALEMLDAQAGEAVSNEMLQSFDEMKQAMEKTVEYGRISERIIQAMMKLSNGGSGSWSTFEFGPVLEEGVFLACHGVHLPQLQVALTLAPDLGEYNGAAQNLMRAFVNLATNAVQSLKERHDRSSAPYSPKLEVVAQRLSDGIKVIIRDNGLGIPGTQIDEVFTPFFTTRVPGDGLGLGLSLCHNIISGEHGGKIHVASTEGEGAEFVIELPFDKRVTS